MERRAFLRRAAIVGGAAVATAAGSGFTSEVDADTKPKSTAAEPATPVNRLHDPRLGHVDVVWQVDTTKKLIALTFDDGPMPLWTPKVLESLAAVRVPATFNLVGKRVLLHRDIATDRRYRHHELANHTWSHRDLAELAPDAAYDELAKAHSAIAQVTGREPTSLRPPYGRLSGSALMAASRMGYRTIALWSLQMLESVYQTPQLVRYIVDHAGAGHIILAHDTGDPQRLRAIDGIQDMVAGLRRRGYEFVRLSDLLREQQA